MAAPLDIRIGLPLPLTVVPHILNAFGQMWPDAAIRTDHPYPDTLVIQIPDSARFDPDAIIEPVPPLSESERELESHLHRWDNGHFDIGTPAAVAEYPIALLKAMFENYPVEDAPNYVEMEAMDPETNERWVITAVRPTGQTPHRLCEIAEAKALELEMTVVELTEALNDMKIQLAALRD